MVVVSGPGFSLGNMEENSHRSDAFVFTGRIARALAPVLMVVFAAGCGYNTIQTYDEQVSAAASQIKVQLQRRADLIPNLVETVKASAKQEQTVFTEVAKVDAKHTGAVKSADLPQMPKA